MINAFQCQKKSEPLTPFTYSPQAVGPNDVRLKITHCGICHSDLHLIDDDWHMTQFPLVPGHEIVGIVEEIGDLIQHIKVGQRVGIGWQGKSCMACEWCLQGDENLCLKQEATCVGHFGGFASHIVADGRFAFVLPDEIPSAYAAPLLCGGATVFAPFVEHKISPNQKVAIVGIGGLGHLALQFAHHYGCEVTAFSSSPDKEKEAKELGATHFVSLKGADLDAHKNGYDFILSSSSSGLDWAMWVSFLRPRGKLCLLGGLEHDFKIPVSHFVEGRKMVCGSNIGSRPVIKRMLKFAARHNVRPLIEEFPLQDVNKAIEKLRQGKLRYRAVLKMS